MKIASATWGNVFGSLQVPPDFLILELSISFSATCSRQFLWQGWLVSPTAREGQQMSAIFIIPVIIPIYFMGLIMEHPENIIVKLLTFIPITAPLTVIVRLDCLRFHSGNYWLVLYSDPVHLGLFVLTTKLFRTYLLMYGKRPDLKESSAALKKLNTCLGNDRFQLSLESIIFVLSFCVCRNPY